MVQTSQATLAVPATLPEALFQAGRHGRNGVHFFSRTGNVETFSYGRLWNDASALAQVLTDQHNLRPGETVALILSTSYDFVRALFAVLIARGVPTCLPTPRLGRMADYHDATVAMLNAARAKLILTETNLVKNLGAVQAALDVPPGLFAVPELAAVAGESADAAASRVETIDAGFAESPAGREHELALIQFSSGTTVAPKPVALTHKNILSNVHAILASFPGDLRDHSGCSWLPLHHDMGLIGGLFAAVAAHGDMTFLRPEDFIARPSAWLKALSHSRATICPAPNFALQICVDRVRDDELVGLDLSHWKIALIGAETVREPTLRRFFDRFAGAGFRYESFTPVYGLAEATLAVTFSDAEQSPRRLRIEREALGRGVVCPVDMHSTIKMNVNANASTDDAGSVTSHAAGEQSFAIDVVSVGRPLDGITVALRDASGADVGEDRVGRIFVSGDSVMAGYFERPDATARAISNGWLDTGDLGFFHDGELYIYGRERDIIILNGRNHDPQTIEFALDVVPGLDHDRAAAVAVDDPARGTETFAVLVEKEKGQPPETLEQLAQSAREAIIAGTGLIPDRILILQTGRLPRTTSGKIKRGASRALLLAGEFEVLAESQRA